MTTSRTLTPAAKKMLEQMRQNQGFYARPTQGPARQLVDAGLAYWADPNGLDRWAIRLTDLGMGQ